MRPLVTCEKPSFRKLILGLTQSKDETILSNYIIFVFLKCFKLVKKDIYY